MELRSYSVIRAGKSAQVRTFIKLKQQEEIIETCVNSSMQSMKVPVENLSDSKERSEIENFLRKKTLEITSNFEKIKSIVNQWYRGEKIDIEECKEKMVDLSEKMHKFQVSDDVNNLERDQKDIEQFLIAFKMNLSKNYSRKGATATALKFTEVSLDDDDKTHCNSAYDFADAKDFNSLIAKTGHTQHWKDEDHLFFLKIRKKIPHIPTMVGIIQKKYPDLSAERIISHEAWYKIYLDLREKQRNSVRTWRAEKELRRQDEIEAVKSAKSNITFGKTDINNRQIVNDRNTLIKQWRMEREKLKSADEERLRQQTKAMQISKEKNFRARTMEIKASLAEYKQQNMNKILKSFSDNSLDKNCRIKSAILLRSLRQRDDEFLNKRKYNIQLRKQRLADNQYSPILPKTTVRSADESTLLKPTKIWEEKCKATGLSEKNPQIIMYIKDVPKLSNQYWRSQKSTLII